MPWKNHILRKIHYFEVFGALDELEVLFSTPEKVFIDVIYGLFQVFEPKMIETIHLLNQFRAN